MKTKKFSQTDYQNTEIEREKIEKREHRKDNIKHALFYIVVLVIAVMYGIFFQFFPNVALIVGVLLLMVAMYVASYFVDD